MNKRQFISWRRVSTGKQGKSGLGLEAQEQIISFCVDRENGELVADYREVYTGTELSGCVELRRAIEHCKAIGATLIIAKSDRFRNTVEALQIYEEMGDGNIYFCDLPHTDKFTLTLFFALAEREALITSIRTKAALDAKKARGEVTGGCDELWGKNTGADRPTALRIARKASSEARLKAARENPANLAFREFLEYWEALHGKIKWRTDWVGMAELLNAKGKKTSSGMPFDANRAKAMYSRVKKIYGL